MTFFPDKVASISIEQARPCWKSFLNQTCAAQPMPLRTFAPCIFWCAVLASAMDNCRKAACAAMPTFPFVRLVRASSESAPKPKTSILFGSLNAPSITRSSVRSMYSKAAAGFVRRHVCTMPTRMKPGSCGSRKAPTTTDISPILTCCRLWSTRLI